MDLTPHELALLQALIVKTGHAVAKERLFEIVFPGATEVQYEAVEVVVYRLRKKLAGTGVTRAAGGAEGAGAIGLSQRPAGT